MAEPLRVAVIGAGSMGANHVRVLTELEEARLVAVADPEVGRAQRLADRYKLAAYADYRELLEREALDAAFVVVPTTLHAAVGGACLEVGAHTFIEKPIASSLEEARALIRLAERRGLRLSVGHIERFNPAIRELARRLRGNQLGQIYQVHARRLGPFPARIRDVGVVVDLATHDIDVMRFLLGVEPTRVYAETARRIHTDHEDLLSGLLRFADGTIGVLDINWLTPTKVREISVTGEGGMFVASYLAQDLAFYRNNDPVTTWGQGVSEGDMTRFTIARAEPLKLELAAFLRAVRNGAEPEVRGEDALVALQIAQAIVRSGECGGTVALEPALAGAHG